MRRHRKVTCEAYGLSVRYLVAGRRIKGHTWAQGCFTAAAVAARVPWPPVLRTLLRQPSAFRKLGIKKVLLLPPPPRPRLLLVAHSHAGHPSRRDRVHVDISRGSRAANNAAIHPVGEN